MTRTCWLELLPWAAQAADPSRGPSPRRERHLAGRSRRTSSPWSSQVQEATRRAGAAPGRGRQAGKRARQKLNEAFVFSGWRSDGVIFCGKHFVKRKDRIEADQKTFCDNLTIILVPKHRCAHLDDLLVKEGITEIKSGHGSRSEREHQSRSKGG